MTILDLQVFFQPVVLLKDKIHPIFKIEINFCGKGDNVGLPQVPAADMYYKNNTDSLLSRGCIMKTTW